MISMVSPKYPNNLVWCPRNSPKIVLLFGVILGEEAQFFGFEAKLVPEIGMGDGNQ